MMKPACARGSQAGTTRLTQRVGLRRSAKSSHYAASPLPLSTLTPLVSPARRVLHALLRPTCTQRLQAVPYWPETSEVQTLLERLGTPFPSEKSVS